MDEESAKESASEPVCPLAVSEEPADVHVPVPALVVPMERETDTEQQKENTAPVTLEVSVPPVVTARETTFSPIKDDNLFPPDLNEDSNGRKLSREDIETMEILKNEENRSTNDVDVPPTVSNGSVELLSAQLKLADKSSARSTPTTRDRDPILKQKNMFSSTSATDLVEYQWPADDNGDYYMLQEQVSTFLGITSFKRKYPEIERRKLDPQEVKYLTANMFVSEVQVTLGLTAVRSRDVCDLMIKEYPEKYQEYTQILDERHKESIKNKHMQYAAPTVEKSQMPNYLKKAMKQVSMYNSRLNRQRKDEFAVYYDMQTNVLQFPRSKVKKADIESTRPSLYPCTLIPGQFQEYCQEYTACELNYMPINTVVYGPPAPIPDELEQVASGSDHQSDEESIKSASARSERSRQVSEKDSVHDASSVQPPSPKPEQVNDSTTETADSGSATEDKERAESNEKAENETSNVEVKEELSQSFMDVDEDPDKPICGLCLKDETCNKKGEPEDLISCSQCDNHGHPSCLDMSKDLVSVIVTYNWQCLECKTCTYCSKPHHEDKMMFCDRCDRGYHTFCVGLRNLPSGLWMCPNCTRSDPDFAKRGGRRGSTGTPRRRKANTEATDAPVDTPQKPKRKRRTKKEMEEAREKERAEKEERLKRRIEKKQEKRRRRQMKAEKDASKMEEGEEDDGEQESSMIGEDSIIDDDSRDNHQTEDHELEDAQDSGDGKEEALTKESDEKVATTDEVGE